jgi:hypothetical protein
VTLDAAAGGRTPDSGSDASADASIVDAGVRDSRAEGATGRTDASTSDASQGSIVGAYVECTDTSCDSVRTQGIKFSADGACIALVGRTTSFSQIVGYCEDRDLDDCRTYAFGGSTLRLFDDDDGSLFLETTVAFDGDRVVLLGAGTTLRRTEAPSRGPCKGLNQACTDDLDCTRSLACAGNTCVPE